MAKVIVIAAMILMIASCGAGQATSRGLSYNVFLTGRQDILTQVKPTLQSEPSVESCASCGLWGGGDHAALGQLTPVIYVEPLSHRPRSSRGDLSADIAATLVSVGGPMRGIGGQLVDAVTGAYGLQAGIGSRARVRRNGGGRAVGLADGQYAAP